MTVVLGRTGSSWEDALLARAAAAQGPTVIPCRSLVDLLVAVETADVDVVVVGEDFPRLVEGLPRLRSLARVVVVGVSAKADMSPEQLQTAQDVPWRSSTEGRPGELTAVWGPPGAWGVTTVAVGLARSLAVTAATLLIDANVHAPGIADELRLPTGGLLQACLSADRGDVALSPERSAGVDVITGVDPGLYPAVHPGALHEVLTAAGSHYEHVVLDLDSAVDGAAEIGIVPDWTTVTSVGLRAADHAVIVIGESAVAQQRLWRSLPAVAQLLTGTATVVINRSADPRRATAEVAARLGEYIPQAAVGWISGPVDERSLAPIVAELCR